MPREPGHDVTLIIRVWFDGDPSSLLRARVVEVADSSPREQVIATVGTSEALHTAIRSWIDGLTIQ
jgi:hypothetical protein